MWGKGFKTLDICFCMAVKDVILRNLVKSGYSMTGGKRLWDIADRSFLYMTPKLARGFLKLREHPRYKATVMDIEINLLKRHAEDLLEFLSQTNGEGLNLIDVGCGNGMKAKELIDAMGGKVNLRYCPVSVNDYLVKEALRNVKKAGFGNVEYKSHVTSNLENVSEIVGVMRNNKYQRNVILLLGSVLASYQINDYLFHLSNVMFKGDCLIIGNGIRKGKRFVDLEKYKHPLFHQWFGILMNELGFKDDEIKYGARFTSERVEGFYEVMADKEIMHGGKKLKFKKGDEIIISTLHKYYARELEKFCRMYFSEVKLFKDSAEEEALVFCRK